MGRPDRKERISKKRERDLADKQSREHKAYKLKVDSPKSMKPPKKLRVKDIDLSNLEDMDKYLDD